MPLTYPEFFCAATGNAPYDYQVRLAGGDAGVECKSQLITIPTGLGKTAAVVLAWVWNRVVQQREDWPRRLVFCLPMRTLVEQTSGVVENWIQNLDDAVNAGKINLAPAAEAQLRRLKKCVPVILMGGAENSAECAEWDIFPEMPAIIVGTQDMLLSRALNRGYGMARSRWPMHFGLLNNGALWVFDETQLMGVGVRTSAQLEGIRQRLGTAENCVTWWASATLDARLIATPDHAQTPPAMALGSDDENNAEVAKRIRAAKKLSPLALTLAGDSSKIVDPYIEKLAPEILAKHHAGTVTIVIVNRVNRARELYASVEKIVLKSTGEKPELVLVHSRFRPKERGELLKKLQSAGEKIIIATQAIEAGVDISARTLITELAPWSSLVQRFGRCNRKGEFNDAGGAEIFWINIESDDAKNAAGAALPYLPEELATARKRLAALAGDASPDALGKIDTGDDPLAEASILRRKDLIELFDTTPDLAGLDIDVGRYIRDGEERDTQVFWREIPAPDGKKQKEPEDMIQPMREELVRVSVPDFKKFADNNKGGIWRWDPLDGAWQELRDIYRIAPGQIYLIDKECGGYSEKLGWTGDKKSKETFFVFPTETRSAKKRPDGQFDDDSQTLFQSIAEHTAAVVEKLCRKLAALPASNSHKDDLLTAAQWHDVGKAHSAFQNFLKTGREIPAEYANALLAKSEFKPGVKNERPHFRHELASALAWLQAGDCGDATSKNLIAYLIAAHHGKVRLSIRAMPGEKAPAAENPAATDRLYARGLWGGDTLPAIDGLLPEQVTLNLAPMQMGETAGEPSWAARILSLRDDTENFGIFRLAWLETLLRAADAEGSKQN